MYKQRMIMTKTPLRITFVGGGFPFASWHARQVICVVAPLRRVSRRLE